jgi:hypothetical protein
MSRMRANQRYPEDVKRWLNKEYTKIRDLARKEKAIIFFGDQAGIRSDHNAGTIGAFNGHLIRSTYPALSR